MVRRIEQGVPVSAASGALARCLVLRAGGGVVFRDDAVNWRAAWR